MLDAKQAVGPLLTGWEEILHLSDRHDFWPVDRQRAAFVDQHRGTQRQHVLDPVRCRPIRKADDEPVVGGERDDRCLVGATRTAALMLDHRCVCPWLAGEGTLQPVRERPVEPADGVQQLRRLRPHRHEDQSREREDPADDHTQHDKRSSNHPSCTLSHCRRGRFGSWCPPFRRATCRRAAAVGRQSADSAPSRTCEYNRRRFGAPVRPSTAERCGRLRAGGPDRTPGGYRVFGFPCWDRRHVTRLWPLVSRRRPEQSAAGSPTC